LGISERTAAYRSASPAVSAGRCFSAFVSGSRLRREPPAVCLPRPPEMKFGTQLRNNLNPDWKFHYVDYSRLKKLLKRRTSGGVRVNAAAVASSGTIISLGGTRVWNFQAVKVGEIGRRVQRCDSIVEDLIEQGDESPVEWEEVEREINLIIGEVNELAKYTRLNYSAFVKIVKKHDKHTHIPLKETFMAKLNEKPFYKENYDSIVLQLSRLYDVVRNMGRPAVSGAMRGEGGAQNFVRRTTKYWVHPDNIMEVKCVILKYLPVLIYNGKGGDAADPAITSVYLDNDQFALYMGRLEKSEKAQAIRLRWYGPATNEEIFVERKTHHEDWTGESSVKERFPLKDKNVDAFLSGEYTVEKAVQKFRERGIKTEKDVSAFERLASEVQRTVLEKKLKPTMRSFYNRIAFQLPGDARLSLIREDNYDGVSRSGTHWRRRDIGTEFPFSQLPDNDICRFPYAILEVKLQTQQGAEPPRWVQDLTTSHLVEEPPTHDFRISRHSLQWAFRDERDVSSKSSSNHGSEEDSIEANDGNSKVPEVRLDMRAIGSETTPLLADSTAANGVSYSGGSGAPRARGRKSAAARALRGLFGRRPSHPGPPASSVGGPAEGGGGSRPSAGGAAKRIAIPTRVEPKVFFANERTFLQWLHFAVLLGSLAVGLVNFGDTAGRTAGVLFTFISIGIMFYALGVYQWRAEKIRRRDKGVYDDLVGPVVLAATLFCAVTVNIIFKFTALGSL
ncbi:MAG: VTC domain-containing protein, partial [Olpidium bornovanus]